jgi:hypothetical protein
MRLTSLRLDIAYDHVGAASGETLSGGQAYAAGRACHHRDFALQVITL